MQLRKSKYVTFITTKRPPPLLGNGLFYIILIPIFLLGTIHNS